MRHNSLFESWNEAFEQFKNGETIRNLNQQREINKNLVADLEEAQNEINYQREQLEVA